MLLQFNANSLASTRQTGTGNNAPGGTLVKVEYLN